MADKANNGSWIDARGKEVPPAYVSEVEKRRDALVEKHFKIVTALEAKLVEEKALFWKEMGAYLDWLNEHAGGKPSDWKGNLQLTNFTGNRQVEVEINEVIEFDERLQLAKAKIDECLKRWSKGGNEKLIVFVNEAFSVDKKGRLNSKMVLRLTRYDLHDETWDSAMELLRDSIRVAGSRRYLRFRKRATPADPWRDLNLNFSSL